MFTLAPPKPLPPARLIAPSDNQFFYHKEQGENLEAYQRFAKVLNRFFEIFKFLPNFESNAIYSGDEGTWSETDDPIDNPSTFTSTISEEGIGSWEDLVASGGDRVAYAGWGNKYRYDGDYAERYGDWHRSTYGYETYWGNGALKKGKNWEVDPVVNDFEHVDKPEPWRNNELPFPTLNNLEELVNPTEYANLLFDNNVSLASIANWGEVKDYMSQYGGLNFYQIMAKGNYPSDYSAWDLDEDGKIDDDQVNNVVASNGFSYEGRDDWNEVNGKGAFLMMEAILEARRSVNYATAKFLGSPYNIKNNDNEAMISQQNNFLDNDLKGVDFHNLTLLYPILAMQHSWHTASVMLTGGSDFNGFRYDVRTIAASNKFRNWLRENVGQYIAGLAQDIIDIATSDLEAKEKATRLKEAQDRLENASKLRNEAFYEIAQPYGKAAEDGEMIGWDYFSKGGINVNDSTTIPEGINPLIVYDNDWRNKYGIGPHANYAIAQILGLSREILKGEKSVNYGGVNYNLYNSNWVVHAMGRIEKYKYQDLQRTLQPMWINMANMQKYRVEMRHWRKKKDEIKEKKFEDQYNEAMQEKHRAEMKAKSAKAKPTRPSSRPKTNSDISPQEALKKIQQQMLSKMINDNLNKMKKARKT